MIFLAVGQDHAPRLCETYCEVHSISLQSISVFKIMSIEDSNNKYEETLISSETDNVKTAQSFGKEPTHVEDLVEERYRYLRHRASIKKLLSR